MKKIILIFLFFLFLSSLLRANTAQDERRLEEEKRKSLSPTEVQLAPQKPTSQQTSSASGSDYFKDLISRRVALRSDVLKVVVVLLGLSDKLQDSDAQLHYLNENNILPKNMTAHFDLSQPLRKGLAAYMFCRALEVKGGIWLRIFGTNQRYALKELVFAGIMPEGNVNELLSGQELVEILTRAAEYLAQKIEDAYKKGKN
jgi:hypothetical protein